MLRRPILLWVAFLLCVNGAFCFDYLVFALQHSPGYCTSISRVRCIEKRMTDNFTIHGLWPYNSTTTEPSRGCVVYDKFELKALNPIRDRLDEVWPSLKANNGAEFWSNQWTKYGVCAVGEQRLTGFREFFNTTLELYDKFNLTEYLVNDGVLPSTKMSYPATEIQHALENDLKKKVNLVCAKVNGTGDILTEVHLCLDKTLTVIDCPQKKARCGKDIFYIPLEGDGRAPNGSPALFSSWIPLASSIAFVALSGLLL